MLAFAGERETSLAERVFTVNFVFFAPEPHEEQNSAPRVFIRPCRDAA